MNQIVASIDFYPYIKNPAHSSSHFWKNSPIWLEQIILHHNSRTGILPVMRFTMGSQELQEFSFQTF